MSFGAVLGFCCACRGTTSTIRHRAGTPGERWRVWGGGSWSGSLAGVNWMRSLRSWPSSCRRSRPGGRSSSSPSRTGPPRGAIETVAPTPARVAGRAVLLIPHRGEAPDEPALHADSREILAIVQAADGPVQVRAVGEELGLQVAVRGKREVSRRPTIFAEVIRARPARASRTSRTPDPRPATSLHTALDDPNESPWATCHSSVWSGVIAEAAPPQASFVHRN